MVIILIRRFARPDREAAFLQRFAEQKPDGHPDFLGETLTRITDGAVLPDGVPRLLAAPEGSGAFLNVARWRSWDAFERHFAVQLAAPGGFDPEIETRRAEIAILAVEPS
ncbi:antibiotic biosynthesis monooxygenase family protein [Enterovirga rhinocerotis]|uniref:Antibiotic biosynthesis monooxygenase n=1 Tax=Enterovirga rhinocerotis TaxID=1339210 RepID=A0A4R7C140_9HYPH|nr:antibiotic biosynthesis monooxygenase [Enterovirga rhinocerotis]TDR90096.1 antibiotic biosynthesis monooxygenase [Enterovirga rhinocerotis]